MSSLVQLAEKGSWYFLAAIHMAPALAVFNPSLLSRLYGVQQGNNGNNPVLVLLRHRAALFLAVNVACTWAAAVPAVRGLAAAVCAISMGSFLALYQSAGQPQVLRSIAVADLIGLAPLAFVSARAFTDLTAA